MKSGLRVVASEHGSVDYACLLGFFSRRGARIHTHVSRVSFFHVFIQVSGATCACPWKSRLFPRKNDGICRGSV